MTAIEPKKNESESDFVQRAHTALMQECPNADDRNRMVFDAWREHHGESEEEKAAHAKFSDDDYAHITNVPAFKEHEYPWMPKKKDGSYVLDEEGHPVVRKENYDFDSLKAICDNLNFRIADTGDFVPLTDKHSPKKGTEESKPRVMGFAGPFGMGMIGNKEPKWGIIAKQEHWFRDKAHMARELPRRSPEVYLGRPMEQRILDPITVLGADTPALDMGIHYSEVGLAGQESEEQFAYYSGPPILAHYDGMAAAPTFPGGGNCAPLEEVKVKKKYSEEPPAAPKVAAPATPEPHEGNTGMISPEDANTIIKALFETEPMQELMKIIEERKAPKQDSPDAKLNDTDPEQAPPVDTGTDPEQAQAVPPPKEQLSEEETPEVKDAVPARTYPDTPGAEHLKGDGDKDKPDSGKERDMPEDKKKPTAAYSEADRDAFVARYAALEQEVAVLKAANVASQNKAAMDARKSKLEAYRFQGFDLDVSEEIERCSLEKMSEDTFQDHLNVIVAHYARIPLNVSLHTPDAPIIEDRHRAATRSVARNGKSGDPEFCNTEEFTNAVVAYSDAEMAKSDFKWDANFYNRCRAAVIEKWETKPKDAAKVG